MIVAFFLAACLNWGPVDTPAEQDLLAAVRGAHHVWLIGNGGSASIASHAAVDLLTAGERASVLTDPALTTCVANDFGYDQVYAYPLQRLMERWDLLIAISSSGQSPNILNGAKAAKAVGATVVTLSGFKPDNPLRALGDVNLWVDSTDYGVVELEHAAILHRLTDKLRT
ncbi:MAG: SIS domain-containing protein [Methylocystis sp.]|uniref:SIS domain-containing protein n=1 Tax=Methylocystis sp. TaxID=1911079 RepID=UPI003DA58140